MQKNKGKFFFGAMLSNFILFLLGGLALAINNLKPLIAPAYTTLAKGVVLWLMNFSLVAGMGFLIERKNENRLHKRKIRTIEDVMAREEDRNVEVVEKVRGRQQTVMEIHAKLDELSNNDTNIPPGNTKDILRVVGTEHTTTSRIVTDPAIDIDEANAEVEMSMVAVEERINALRLTQQKASAEQDRISPPLP